jgi:hypothetical protein
MGCGTREGFCIALEIIVDLNPDLNREIEEGNWRSWFGAGYGYGFGFGHSLHRLEEFNYWMGVRKYGDTEDSWNLDVGCTFWFWICPGRNGVV